MSKTTALVFNVPSIYSTTMWAIHIYELIKGANKKLLKSEEVCLAYNQFVKCLETHSAIFQTWLPLNKYKNGFALNNNFDLCYGIPGRCINNVSRNDLERCLNEIISNYTPLYDLVKDDVTPYMESKYKEYSKKKEIKALKKNILSYEKKINKWQENIYKYQNMLAESTNKLFELENK